MINFLLKHPEIIEGATSKKDKVKEGEVSVKGNLRIWTKYFDSLSGIGNFEENIDMVMNLGMGSLPNEHIVMFVNFIKNGLDKLPSPKELFKSTPKVAIESLREVIKTGSSRRQDIAGILAKRLMNFAVSNSDEFTPDMVDCYGKMLEDGILGEELVVVSCRKVIEKPKFAGLLKSNKLAGIS